MSTRQRLLLLLPTQGYRAQEFVDAAARLAVDLTVASEEPSTLEMRNPAGLLTLDFTDPDTAARQAAAFAREHPIDAVVGVDDATTALQAAIAAELGIPSNSFAAVTTARDKYRMRQALAAAGLPGPPFWVFSRDDDSARCAAGIQYPCVVKPLSLSASRGVIRANNPEEFISAFERVARLLRELHPHPPTPSPALRERGSYHPDTQTPTHPHTHTSTHPHTDAPHHSILVEGYVPGLEVALDGLLMEGRLQVLALWDKPDPLEGPYFEETLYITPSLLPPAMQEEIRSMVARAAQALELFEGPIHAELRISPSGPVLIELNPRSIGGKCSRALRFEPGVSLEEIILRRALRMEIPSLEQEASASGVMMLPIPGKGTLEEVTGQQEALAVPGIVDLILTAHRGQELVPLPEGSAYLGFLFARGSTPQAVEHSLRAAYGSLRFVLDTGG